MRVTHVWVRLRKHGDADVDDEVWQIKGESRPLPDGVTALWGPYPDFEPWLTILATARTVATFEEKARAREGGVLWVLKPRDEGRVLH